MALDPQTIPFTPRSDEFWRFEADIMKVQQTQIDHAERLARLEKRQEDNAKIKSVWNSSSPFPGVLSGTPQQRPVNQSPIDAFGTFDDQSNLIGSLHLDAEDEPRRVGATSRANSVRFDETANQGHWSHPSRTSIELIPRSSSSIGTHPLLERTYSHKSDGRQSSAGQSVQSGLGGRANSIGMDTPFSIIGPSPLDAPGITPGLSFLGPVPCIIRCWLTTNFRHDALLYAAVCSGSYASHIDEGLLDSLALRRSIRTDGQGNRRVKLAVYLPEATLRPSRTSSSSRSSSPLPQLPTLSVDFNVLARRSDAAEDAQLVAQQSRRTVRIFIGSNVLQTRRADILFSSKLLTLFDDEQNKLSIPMVRPEDDTTFKGLGMVNNPVTVPIYDDEEGSLSASQVLELKGLQQALPRKEVIFAPEPISSITSNPLESLTSRNLPRADSPASVAGRSSFDERIASPPQSSIPAEVPSQSQEESILASQSSRSSTNGPSMWGSWRRDPSDKPATTRPDWKANRDANYQRREHGIKVLRPVKAAVSTSSATPNRSVSSTSVNNIQPASPSPSITATSTSTTTAQSRFFDDGKRRVSLEDLDNSSSGTMGKRISPIIMPSLNPPEIQQQSSQQPRLISSLTNSTLNRANSSSNPLPPPPPGFVGLGPNGLNLESSTAASNAVVGAAAAPPPGTTTKKSNPVGGASAFSWMNK